MTNKSIPSYQFAPEDASGIAREWSGIASALPRKLFTLLFCLLFIGVGTAWGATYTLAWGSVTSGSNYTNFTANSGSVTNVCSFTTAKNSALNAPAYNATDKELRIYNNKSGTPNYTTDGGQITITPASGVTITGVTITATASYQPTTKYKIGSGSLTALPAWSSNSTSVSGLSVGSSSSITIQNCNTSSKQLRIKTIVITYTATSPTLSVSDNATSLAIGDAKVNGSGETNSTLTFSGSNLSANATLAISGTNASMFTVSPTSVTPSSKTITNQTITVTYTPTSAGSHTATLTISSTGATSKEITLTGTGKYEVIWKNNGGDYTTTLVASGSRPTFPDNPTSCDAGEGASTTFYGWAANGSTWSGKINSLAGKTIYTSAASMPTVSANGTTYHAVFCKGGALTYATSIAANDVVYLATSTESGASGVTGANANGKDATVSTTQADWMPFTVQTNSTGWKLQNGTNYIQATAKNFAFTTSTPNVLTFAQEGSTGKYRMIYNDSSDDYALSKNSSGDYWRFYKTNNSYVWYYVLKASAGTNYMTNCCTSLGSINGSVSWTNPTQAVVTWDKLDDQVSAWALSWSPNTAGSSITSAIADYGLTQKTATVSGLACGTEYTFTLTPTLKSGVCTPASNPTIESTSTKYSITKASVTGGSFTTKISSTAVTEACNSSTISIAATPSTGYTFSSWQITNDDDDDDDVTSTLLGVNSTTSPTSFTMPSYNLTITPTFSCIEPVIGTNPASASYTEGASPSALTVAATLSSGTLTYKWQKSTNSGVSWTDESGTGYNTATYAAANISTSLSANGVQYRCIVGNSEGGCTVTSGVATITVTAASKCVAPTFDPVAGTYNSSQTVTISSSTSGSTIYYTTNGSTPTTSSSHGTEGEASASVTVSSSLTLKAIAYKGGMTTSDVSDAAYVICSTDPSFSTTSSSNITITGARVTCAGITKGTCDIDAYGIVYGTSEHPTGNAQQKGTDASTNVSSYYVDLTGLTAATTYYARPYATVNGKTVYGTEISFTTLHIPEITVNETSRAFGTKKVDGSYEMSFTVSGEYLQSNIGLAISGTNEAMFSVDKTSLTPSTGTVGSTTVTVTYTPSAAGSHSATVSITSTNATTKTVTLSGTGQYEDTYMTAMHEGASGWTAYASGHTESGAGYTIPNPGDVAKAGTGCEGIHYHFSGWVEETYKASPSGHIVAASGTKDASNKTFWAVWEKESDESSPVTYTKVTTISEGTYLMATMTNAQYVHQTTFAYAGKKLNDAVSPEYIWGDTIPVNISTNVISSKPANAKEITVTLGTGVNEGYFSMYDGDKYITMTTKGKFTFADDISYEWELNGNAYIHNKGTYDKVATWMIILNNGNSGSPSAYFVPMKDKDEGYNSGSYYYHAFLFKKAGGIVYDDPKVECICSADPVAGTAAVDAEGTFSASSIAVKATGASTGHTDCSYTDYGFVWSSSVTTPTLVEETGAASTNCTKVPVGNDGQVTTFTGSLEGSFTANNPIYFRSYVKNGKADGTYQYSSVVTITPRSVTFNLNGHGSSTPATQFVNNGSKATDPSYSESVTGYIFGDWYKEVGCTNQWNFATDVVSGESKTLYAKWTPISYSVRFNNNDANYLGTATGSMSDQSFDYDESKALTANGFSLAGYDFAGWATTPTGDVEHLDEAKVENLSSTNSDVVDLYAIWTAKSYDVTLAATNETSSVGEQVVTATYNAAMPTTKKGSGDVVAPSRTGYTFTGWEYSSTTYYNYDASTSTLSSAHVWDQPNSTTTLTPKWSINSYTLTWNLGGGTVATAGTGAAEGATGTPNSSVEYNTAIKAPTVTKAGYNFAGWDEDVAATMPAEATTYTATWTAKTLTSISLAEASVSVYVGEIKYVNVIFDPTDILSKAFSQAATPSYCQLSSYSSYNQLKITGGRAGADVSVDRTETVSIKYTADETKTASISVTVKPLPTITFVDLIHNKSDFANSGDGWTAGTGVLSSTVSTGVVSHAKKTPTHTDVSAPVGGNACETGHLHLMGWIRSDYSKVADYMNGTGEAPSVSDLTTAGAEYWFTPNADINVETYNGKTFYAVWAVEE